MISYVRRVGGSTPSEGAKPPDASTFSKMRLEFEFAQQVDGT